MLRLVIAFVLGFTIIWGLLGSQKALSLPMLQEKSRLPISFAAVSVMGQPPIFTDMFRSRMSSARYLTFIFPVLWRKRHKNFEPSPPIFGPCRQQRSRPSKPSTR
jgi:hypothetical protein